MLNGFATPEGTQRYAAAHPDLTFHSLSETGLHVSPVGFGGYRVDTGIPGYHEALNLALVEGINLIDTSTNYADGGSEELIGQTINALVRQGQLQRDQLVIVTKGGYLQGSNFQLSQRRRELGQPFPDLVPYMSDLEHCIHPEFLADQITRSLRRLDMDTIDVYLLHNPEYYLSWAKTQTMPLDEARAEYYRRLKLAFAHLEKEVERGRIRYYGISSNSFPYAAAHPEFTSLATCWELARQTRARHHFRVIQLPLNLLETGAVTQINQPSGQSVLEFAQGHQLAVLVNRPLNAYQNSNLTRLADLPEPDYVSPAAVDARIANLVAQELTLHRDILPVLDVTADVQDQLGQMLSAGQALDGYWLGINNHQRWLETRSGYLIPRINSALRFLEMLKKQPEGLDNWIEQYITAANMTFEAITAYYQEQALDEAGQLQAKVKAISPDWAAAATFSQLAIRVLRSTQGVTSVLVGMRRALYVQDVLTELRRPVIQSPHTEAWLKLQAQL
ncbi:MAG: aldo/keto reductase [Chloroflexi bacterium]|nr:aldo/keto reductase [Chloroflexota bacterium]MBP8055850.1 aldo/keto reductase [Chloroflexota bacterium]